MFRTIKKQKLKKQNFFAGAVQRGRALMSRDSDQRQDVILWALIAYLAMVFLIGGGSRADVQSLILLRPLGVLACGAALLTFSADRLKRYRFLAVMAGLVLVLVGLHLVPLPPGIWQALPGRERIVEIDQAVGLSGNWRPLTMVPSAGWNAFYSLFVPLGAFLLAIQLSARNLHRLIMPLIIIVLLSGILGILQVAGDPKGPLYLYRITNEGASVGLLANRNHQAFLMLTMFPLLAYFAAMPPKSEESFKIRMLVAVVGALMLIPLILVTGSRMGLLLMLLVAPATALIYTRPEMPVRKRRTERKSYVAPAALAVGVILMTMVTALASRAEALQRLLGSNVGEDERAGVWRMLLEISGQYLPFGSGVGSFVDVYQMYEPLEQLRPTYLNHAHNDWLEVWMTLGLPGAALLVAALAGFAIGALSLLRKRTKSDQLARLGRVGMVVVAIMGLASLSDYPLRVPSLACLFVIACVWMRASLNASPETAGKRATD